MAGAVVHPQRAVAQLERAAVGSGRVTVGAPAPGAEAARRPRAAPCARPRGCRGAASARSAKASSSSVLGAVARQPGREQVERGDLGARSGAARIVDQAEVVDVLVGDDDQLEVLDAPPVRARARCSSSSSALPEFGPASTSVSGSSSIR